MDTYRCKSLVNFLILLGRAVIKLSDKLLIINYC